MSGHLGWMQCASCGHQFEVRRGVYRCPNCKTHYAAKIEDAAACKCFDCLAKRKKWRADRGTPTKWRTG